MNQIKIKVLIKFLKLNVQIVIKLLLIQNFLLQEHKLVFFQEIALIAQVSYI